MDLKLNGKKALVLGGTRGIGRAIVETLAGEGCAVGLCARTGAQVDEVVAALTAKGATATGAAVDVTDGAALEAWIQASAQTLGGVDILISNASAFAVGSAAEAWEKSFKLDVLGAVRAFEAAAPFLEAAAARTGDASFVTIASISGHAAASGPDAYGGMKAALIHYTKGVARGWAAKKVRANVISPGTVYFEGGVWNLVEQYNPDMYQGAINRNPMGRMASPQEIADMAVFLSSPRSGFTTGATVVVDGALLEGVIL